LDHVACAHECFAAEPGGRAEQKIPTRAAKQATMRVQHHHFTCPCKRAKKHEEVLPALPGQPLGRNREHIRTKRAQRLEPFQMIANFKLGP
jgi:hypothetical protein